MTRAQANLLRAFALWTVWVWATRVGNVLGDDRSVGFKVVHIVLAVVSIAFAVATWVVVARVRRGAVHQSAPAVDHTDRRDQADAESGRGESDVRTARH